MNPKVLIVDRDGHNRHRLAQRLRQRGCRVALAEGLTQGEKFIRRRKADVVVLDLRSLGDEALVLLQIINRTQPAVRSILLTSPAHIPLSIAGMQLGAFDDLMAPVDVDHLLGRLRAAWESPRHRWHEVFSGPPPEADPPPSRAPTPNRGREKMEDFKILLVDDEQDFLESLTERLELRDLKPDTARSGEEALQRVQTDEPTVIVLDLRMPGMDGFAVCRSIKRTSNGEHTSVIAVTAYASADVEKRILDCGADGYLAKPLEIELLFSIAEAQLGWRLGEARSDSALVADSMGHRVSS